MSSASFGTVNATGLNVSGVLQASEIRTTQPVQVSNLTATGLTTLANVTATGLTSLSNVAVSGPSTLSSLSVSGATSVSNLNLGGNLQVTVKGATANTTNSMFADLMVLTPEGRTALAKALNYGQNANVFIENKYIPLLSNGYSGKGVLYGAGERGLQFRAPGFRHITNPEHIYATSANTFSDSQMMNKSINPPGGVTPHTYTSAALVIGFDLHARIIDGQYQVVNDSSIGNPPIHNADGFVMGPAYNADVVSMELMPGYNGAGGDPTFITEFPSMLDFLDDMYIEVVEKAFYKGVLVAASNQTWNNLNSTYNYYPETSRYTGVGNPISYIQSLAADHNMVFCSAAGNEVYYNTNPQSVSINVPQDNGGSGVMYLTADARNVLTVGTKMLGPLSVYGPTTFSVLGEDYLQRRFWSNIAPGAPDRTMITDSTTYWTSNIYSQGAQFNVSYHGHGRTADKAGPGETNRVKPDIISAQGGFYNVIAYPAITQADNTKNWLYATLLTGATSGTSMTLAGGVCLLREALPLYDAHQIRECIMLSASNGNLTNANTYNGLGYGLINLEAALAYGQARTHFLPPKLTAGNWLYSAGFQANVLAGASNTLSPFQPFTQFEVASNTFSPKSVQSFQCPRDDEIYTSNAAYTTAYNNYTTAYNTYVGRKPSLWSAGVLDLSPGRGLWGSSATRSFEAPTFDVVSTRSWISTSPEDLQEIKDLMVANGIKVCVTSNLLGAFSVDAESIEQLSAVVNGNTKIHGVFPVMRMQMADNWCSPLE